MGDGNRWTDAMRSKDVRRFLERNGFEVCDEDVSFTYLNNNEPADPPVKTLGVTNDDGDGYEVTVDKDGLNIGSQKIAFSRAEEIISEMRIYLAEHGIDA
jgi:hypothetical protein